MASNRSLGRFHPWVLVAFLWVVALLNYIDRQVIFSVFPLVGAELNLSNSQLGLLSSSFFWVYAILSPFAGFLADRGVLGDDCVLSDISVNSIGPHTEGAAWHVDAPLGQLPEPLPEFPLTLQNVWMLDDFTAENGATRVVPGSHKRRRRPAWAGGRMEDEVILTAPAGSMAVWLSNTWHRVGPNSTDYPRRAILCYYDRSWIKPFSDYRTSIPRELLERYSPTLRYLLGFSANGLVRA